MSTILREILTLLRELDRDIEPWVCDVICDNLLHELNTSTEVSDELLELLRKISDEPMHNTRLRLKIIEIVLKTGVVKVARPSVIMSELESHPLEVFNIWISNPSGARMCMDQLGPALIAASTSPNMSTRQAAVKLAAVTFATDNFCRYKYKDMYEQLEQSFIIDVLAYMFNCGDTESAADLARRNLSPQLESDTILALCPLRVYLLSKELYDTYPPVRPTLNYTSRELYWKMFYKLILSSSQAVKSGVVEEILKGLCSSLNVEVLASVTKTVVVQVSMMSTSEFVSRLRRQFRAFPVLQKVMDTIYDECGDLQSQRAALALLDDLMELNVLEGVIKVSHVCHHQTRCGAAAADPTHSSAASANSADSSDVLCFVSTLLTFVSECTPDTLSLCTDTLYKVFNQPFFRRKCAESDLFYNLNTLLIRKLRHVDSRVRDLALELVRNIDGSVLRADIVLLVLHMSYSDCDYYVKSSCFKVLADLGTELLGQVLETDQEDIVVGILSKMIASVEHDDSMVAISFFNFLQMNYDVVLRGLLDNNITSLQQSGTRSAGPVPGQDPVVKQDPVVEQDPVVKLDPGLVQDMVVEQDPGLVQGPVVKQDPGLVQDMVVKQDPGLVQELVVKQDPGLVQDMVVEQDPGLVQDPVVEQDPGLVQETNLEDVIESVCDSQDCSDVQIIRRYEDRVTSSDGQVTSSARVIAGIFTILTTDRCDIERMKASLDLVIHILIKIPDRTHLMNYLQSAYFPLVESFNGPFIRDSIRRFNLVLGGFHVFVEKTTPDKADLQTVLDLLKSTPDPDIVMDCY